MIQVLIFKLDKEFFGCDLKTLREIHRVMPVTPVPRAPLFIKGVSNLRGLILPVIDLRKRLGFPGSKSPDKGSRIVIVEELGENIGFEIDGVKEVVRLDPSAIMPFEGGAEFKGQEAVWGMLRQSWGIVTLLDLKSLLSGDYNSLPDKMLK